MTLADRAAAYAKAYPDWPASWPHVGQEQGRDVLYATWVIGNDYRNPTKFYGAYPKGFLNRLMALFPDVALASAGVVPGPDAHWPVLHLFAGSVPPGRYLRVDVRYDQEAGVTPDLVCSVYDIAHPRGWSPWLFDLVIADPPYSQADAEKYGTPMVDRRRAIAAVADVVPPGGFLAWLDTCWPMHSKRQWVTVGRIFIQRSTNHRVRVLSLFERVAA